MKADQHHAWQSSALLAVHWRVVLAAYPRRTAHLNEALPKQQNTCRDSVKRDPKGEEEKNDKS
jgi:hypothetical protein